jgi:hypothetical protein
MAMSSLVAGKFLLAHPSSDQGETLDHVRPIDRIFRHGQKLHRTFLFP